jgi:membrane-associated phospholipid phosphatase
MALNQALKVGGGEEPSRTNGGAMHALGHGFRSGHAMNLTVVYGMLLVVVAWPTLRTWTGRVVTLTTTSAVIAVIAE